VRAEEVRSFLALAREDLEVADTLRSTHGRPAAFHLQQAAEKLLKAVLTAEGIDFPKGHHIGALAASLPEAHPWRADLMALDGLSSFATALRYPMPGGALPTAPEVPELASASDRLTRLLDEVQGWLLAAGSPRSGA
jgi:HEPN domain-containing protein